LTDRRGSPALDRCVGDGAGFLAGAYGSELHLWHGAGFDDLLSVGDIDRQLSGAGLRRPAIRLVQDGEVIPPARWTRRARTGGTWIDDLADPGRTLGLFGQGATIVLQSLHRWWPPLTRFCRELEDAIGHPVQANAYLTPAGAAGFTPHHDTHDVFVLQVHGAKHWTIRAPLVEAPLVRHRSDHRAAAAQPVVLETDLEPGDCLYLPRGHIHSAAAQEVLSLHLTIGVLAVTRHDLLQRIVDATADVPAFRRTLPTDHAADVATAGRAVKEVVADFIGWLEGLDLDAVAADLVERASNRRAPLLDGLLSDMARLGDIDDTTVLRRRPGVRCRLEAGDVGRVVLVLRDRRVDLPAAVEPALLRMLEGSPHRVDALADSMDGASRLVLVRRLVREGVLQVVTDQL
jgi:lysine-specific demethylase/histidyl-hydroxylase NO66